MDVESLAEIENSRKNYNVTEVLIRLKNDPTKTPQAKMDAVKEIICGKKNENFTVQNDREEISGKKMKTFNVIIIALKSIIQVML